VRRRTEDISRPAVRCLNQVYLETRGDPSREIAVLRVILLTPRDAGLCAGAPVSACRWCRERRPVDKEGWGACPGPLAAGTHSASADEEG
jgi:hypothetical protein